MHRIWFQSLLFSVGVLTAAGAPSIERVQVEPMKTSVYVATITLVPGVFTRQGDTYVTDYEVKVRPWFFWGETGRVTIRMPAAEVARVLRGETVEFTGEGASHKRKPRQVTGRLTPTDSGGGKLKIRISADGYTLVFNGAYRLSGAGPG